MDSSKVTVSKGGTKLTTFEAYGDVDLLMVFLTAIERMKSVGEMA